MYEQEKQAHLQCIQANFQSFPNVDYFLLLQDDAQPIDKNFYYYLSSLIDNRIKQQWPLNSYRQQPAFIKIYHPRWLIDYLHLCFLPKQNHSMYYKINKIKPIALLSFKTFK